MKVQKASTTTTAPIGKTATETRHASPALADGFERGVSGVVRAPQLAAKIGDLKAGALQVTSDPGALASSILPEVGASSLRVGSRSGDAPTDLTGSTRGHLTEEEGWDAAKPSRPGDDAAREAANRAALEAELFLGREEMPNPGEGGPPSAPHGDWSDFGDACAGIGGGFALGATVVAGKTPPGAAFAAGASVGWLVNRGLDAVIGRGEGSTGDWIGEKIHGPATGPVADDPAVKARADQNAKMRAHHGGIEPQALVGSGDGRSTKPKWTEDLGTGRGTTAGGKGGTNGAGHASGGTGDGKGSGAVHALDQKVNGGGERLRRVFAGTQYEARMDPSVPALRHQDSRKERREPSSGASVAGGTSGTLQSSVAALLGLKNDGDETTRRAADQNLRARPNLASKPVPNLSSGNTPRPR